jgi:transposase
MRTSFHGIMKPLTITDASNATLVLQDEIRRSEESRYDHRLHGVLLVAQGLTCPEVARVLGDSPRSIEYWVERFEDKGLAKGDRPGRPARLTPAQLGEIERILRRTPRNAGLGVTLWDGKTLSAWIAREQGSNRELGNVSGCFGNWDFVCIPQSSVRLQHQKQAASRRHQ